MNIFAVMQNIAKSGLEKQVVREADYYDSEGFLVCGVCGERRQMIRYFPDPTEDDPKRTSPVKTTADCICERRIKAAEDQRQREEEDREVVKKLRALSMMDEKYSAASFEKFIKTKENEKNLTLCKRYASKFEAMEDKGQGLLLWGNVGTGKSYAAACIANELLDRKIPVVMTSFADLLHYFRADFSNEDKIMEKLDSARLLVLDDLGAESGSEYSLEKVYNVIDVFYRKRTPMIVTTNLTVQEMLSETRVSYSRIYDRIFEACYPMQFTGVSFRKKAANQRFSELEDILLNEEEGGANDGGN